MIEVLTLLGIFLCVLGIAFIWIKPSMNYLKEANLI